MIQKISLTNFQSHKSTELEFCNGINSIIGDSDNGKTAVLRALYWSIYNRPVGDVFVSDWIKDEKDNIKKDAKTEVIIEKDNNILHRIKAKNKNGYIVNSNELNAIGVDVPEEVITFFNVNDVNLQKQLDGPFLLSESPINIAKFFNKLVKLDDIDVYLKAIDGKKRKNNASKKLVQAQLEELNTKLNTFDWIDAVKKLYSKLEKIASKLNEQSEKLNSLKIGIDRWKAITKIKNQFKDLNILGKKCDAFEKLQIAETEYISDLSKLDKMINVFNESKTILNKYTSLDNITTLLNKVKKINDKLNEKEKQYMELDKICSTHLLYAIRLEDSINNIKELTEKLPENCPLCGGVL